MKTIVSPTTTDQKRVAKYFPLEKHYLGIKSMEIQS